MKTLSEAEELAFIAEIHARPDMEHAMTRVREGLNLLQVRSQMLLGLVTICLTITGFSGHRLAGSGSPARVFIFLGVISVLISAITLICGPLHINWLTRARADTLEETVIYLLRRRNARTRIYHLAAGFLLVGLTGYVLSLGCYLLSLWA